MTHINSFFRSAFEAASSPVGLLVFMALLVMGASSLVSSVR